MPTTYNQLTSDNFTRANNASLGVNWTATSFAAQILTNSCRGTASTNCISMFVGDGPWPNDQWSELVITARVNNSCIVAAGVRLNGRISGYFGGAFTLGTPGVYQIWRAWANASTVLATSAVNVTAGDTIRLTVQSTPTGPLLTLFQNGVSILTFTDTAALGQGNATGAIASGYGPGLWIAPDGTVANAIANSWAAGAVVNVPTIVNGSGSNVGGTNVFLGELTALGQCVQFTVGPASRNFNGLLQMIVSATPNPPTTTTPRVNFPMWVLEGSQDNGKSWWTIPAVSFSTRARTIGDSSGLYASAYDISGLSGGAIFRFGLASGTDITNLPVFALAG